MRIILGIFSILTVFMVAEGTTETYQTTLSEPVNITDITHQPSPGKPGGTRVTIMLNKRPQFLVSRIKNQLICRIYDAQLQFSIEKPILHHHLVTSMIVRQRGNNVESIITLIRSDVLYVPSISTHPFQLHFDIWRRPPSVPNVSLRASPRQLIPMKSVLSQVPQTNIPETVQNILSQQISTKVHVMGVVNAPGDYELPRDRKLLDILINAKVPNSFPSEAHLLRLPKKIVDKDMIEIYPPFIVDVNRLLRKEEQIQNIILHGGDFIIVTAKMGSASQYVYVINNVIKPGAYEYKENHTILDTILRAGGFAKSALRNHALIIRTFDEILQVLKVEMGDVFDRGDMEKNIEVLPGDIIFIPDKTRSTAYK